MRLFELRTTHDKCNALLRFAMENADIHQVDLGGIPFTFSLIRKIRTSSDLDFFHEILPRIDLDQKVHGQGLIEFSLEDADLSSPVYHGVLLAMMKVSCRGMLPFEKSSRSKTWFLILVVLSRSADQSASCDG
jgi:hypothetical protein